MNKLLFLWLFSVYTYGTAEDLPLIETKYGLIQGTYDKSYENRIFSQFLGVPYAQPPLQELRFEEPQPLKKWTGIWRANTSIACIQINHWHEPEGGEFMGQEDCLYLNVFVPNERPTKNDLLDVVVHFHSGAFNFGYGNGYAGPKYLMDINVILVTINYRLGPLGFLSTEDDVVPGNNGMKDQVAALKWIKNNILSFGGNSNSITITGLSAGGASVHYHYLSPLSKGLFNKGISVSGNALCPWTSQEGALEKARRLGAAVGCSQRETKKLIKCLKQRPAQQIVENVRMFRPWLYNPFSPFGLVVEKSGKHPFLHKHPYELLSKGEVLNLPWLTSVTSEEGLYPAADYAVKKNYLPDLDRRWTELASVVLDYNYTLPLDQHATIAKKIKDHYLKDNSPISKKTYNRLIQMVGDRHFVVPAEQTAKLQAKANSEPVYFYYFSYTGEKVSTYSVYYTNSEKKYGVCHGDDMMYIFSMPNRPLTKMTKTDESMKDILLNLWSTFIKTGSPKVKKINWKPVSKDLKKEIDYLHIKSPEDILMTKAQELGHRTFWESLGFNENDKLLVKVNEEL